MRLRLMQRIDQIALGLLALMLPFELKTPLLNVGSIVVTNVEVVLYLAMALWLISRLLIRRDFRTTWSPLHSAVIGWIAALIISAVTAPTLRVEAIKFALRSLGGCLVFFAAADGLREANARRWVLNALVIGGIVSALAGLAEVCLPAVADALTAFKTQPSMLGAFLRASGTFQYANTAAMYWEAVLPIGLMIIQPRRMKWLALIIVAVLAEAILLSASRAALISAAISIVAVIAIGWRNRSGWRLAALGLIVVIGLTVLHFIVTPWMTSRLQSANDVAWYRAAYRPAQTTLRMNAGEVITTSVTIENRSVQTWSARGSKVVALSYHWLSADRSGLVSYEGSRTALPADLRPGEAITVEALVKAPATPGAYTLQWDLVQEGVTWFSAKTNEAALVPVEVVARTSVDASSSVSTTAPLEFMPQPERSELWQAAIRIGLAWPITGAGPDNFRHIYGSYLGYERFDDRITANSLYFETWANMGTLGLISLIGLLTTMGWIMRRALRETRSIAPWFMGVGAALLAFWLHGSLDYFLEFTPTYGLFWLLMGLLSSTSHD